jgi:hypothetical protein
MRHCALALFLALAFLIPCCGLAQVSQEQRVIDSLVRIADSMNMRGIERIDTVVTDTPQRIPGMDSARSDSLRRDSAAIRDTTAAAPQAPKGQPYTLTGIVRDKATGEGIPFATVFFPGTDVGIPADLDGKFSLSFMFPPRDTLRVTAIGYTTWNRRISFGADHDPKLEIELSRETTTLGEFVFHAGEDPALALMKKIIAAKPGNNPDRLSAYSYQVYNKLEVDLQHLSRKQFESLPVPMIKKFGFIFNNLDSTSEKTPFLPFFLTETFSDYYFQRDPKKQREFIRASQVKGVRNESIDQFLGSYHQSVNAYNNFLPVFDKRFVSPISDNGPFYYKYRIKDTQMAYGHPIILVEFHPRRNGEACFFGDFWVVDSIYALQRISMEVPKDANINYVSRVSLYQETAPVADSMWFTLKEKFVSDFHLPYSPKLPGFVGRKTTVYKNIATNADSIAAVVNNRKYRRDVIMDDTARRQDEAFWESARPDTLSKNERAIYTMIDSLEGLPLFQKFKNTMNFLFGGYVSVGAVNIGPYYNLYSSNTVEGSRFRLGLATNQKLFKDIRISGYGAYGTKDERFKGYGDILWITNRKQRTYLYASYRYDVDRSNSYYDVQSGADNIFATIARKAGVPFKLAFVKDARFEYAQEFYNGFSQQISLRHLNFMPYKPLPDQGIYQNEEGAPAASSTSAEIGLRLRYAYKEEFLESQYLRTSLGSKYPIVEVRGRLGVKGVLGGAYEYKKINISVSDNVRIAPFGKIYYNLFAGQVFGKLPYNLLEVIPGNENYYYNRLAFNMMDRYEFIADRYAGFNFEHTLGGGIFNYIPGLKRAKLRQFWTAKGIIGSLSPENQALNLKKGYPFKTLEDHPYIELGTGIENILQVFRIDFVWRVLPKAMPGEEQRKYFGIFGSVRLHF